MKEVILKEIICKYNKENYNLLKLGKENKFNILLFNIPHTKLNAKVVKELTYDKIRSIWQK